MQPVSHAMLVSRVNTDNNSNNGGASRSGFRFYTTFDSMYREIKQLCKKNVDF